MTVIKEIAKKILGILMNIIPLKNTIIFESNPDMTDNTYAIYKKLVERSYNDKYKFVWVVKNITEFKNVCEKNVSFIEWRPKSILGVIKKMWVFYTAKFIINSHTNIGRRRNGQVVVCLGHGTPIKDITKYVMADPECDFLICPSEALINHFSIQFKVSKEQIYLSGYPRNDALFNKLGVLDKVIENRVPRKSIIWLPTFRQQKDTGRQDSEFEFPLGIPIIYTVEQLDKINDALVKNDILIILKPHPAQDMSVINAKELSNFVILTDDMMMKEKVQLYELLSDTDALITDYSSVYCDYLLLNKPIAITLDDYVEYSSKNGFSFNDTKEILKGKRVYDVDDMIEFIDNVGKGIDAHANERDEAKNMFNTYKNGRYSDMVVDNLVEKYAL